jgi:2-hydroxycyclohexanecarboxyl-CoA dehydrogenase
MGHEPTGERVVVVTGGTRGTGAEIVRQFLAAKYRTISVARRTAPETVRQEGCLYFEADVTRPHQLDAVAEQVIAHCGRIDVWINNAGYGRMVPFVDGDEAAWMEIFNVNFHGALNGCRTALRAMRGRGGCIINISSLAGLMAPANHSAYSVAKAAVIALTRSLSVEVAQSGVRVNAIAPGPIDTEGFRAAGGDAARRSQTIPTRRMIQPEEVARTCLFLSSEMPSLTGQVVVLDGGSAAAGCYMT